MVNEKQRNILLLVEQFKAGSNKAFDELLNLYHPMVLHVCYRLLQNEPDAHDAAQEVFVKIFHALKKWQPDATLKTWMYRIAVNHCLNMLRFRKRKQFLISISELKKSNIVLTGPTDHDPDDELQKKERAVAVQNALDQLYPEQRTVIVLHRFEGLSYKEIAHIMGTSVASVESRMHRARKRLAQILIDYKET